MAFGVDLYGAVPYGWGLDEIGEPLPARVVVFNIGWIKGIVWSLAHTIATGLITVVVKLNGSNVLSHSIFAGSVTKAYKILDEGNRIAIALGDYIECKVVTSADFTVAGVPPWVTADVLLEYAA
jgi:hypothetical protein